MENGWAQQPVAPEELYDLIFDPNERTNLVGDPSHREVLAEMQKRLDVWMHSTNDPLMQGPVKAPSGARFNDPNQISPNDPTEVVP